MSLAAQTISPIPEQTAQVAQQAFRKGNLYLTIGDQIGMIFQSEDFADLYAREGKPAIPPYLLALVLIFQYIENLSDREAADAVRARIDWKYALHLPLEDGGFDFSVLSEFRDRLLENEAGTRMFEQVLQRLVDLGLLKKGGKQRTDSTHVLSASRQLSRLEMVMETLRMALEALATVAPSWLQEHGETDWYLRYRRHWRSRRVPKGKPKREALLLQVAADGYTLLERLEGAEEGLRELEAVVRLEQIWEQTFEQTEEGPRLRRKAKASRGAETIVTPHDPEARRSVHGEQEWHGYRVHWTERCDDDAPRLITDVRVVPATTPDVNLTLEIQDALAERDLTPAQHLVDAGYVAGHIIEESRDKHHIEVLGPIGRDTSWQARTGGFTLDQFHIDWENQVATCPQGHPSSVWSPSTNDFDQPVVHIRFSKKVCDACPVRTRCTRAKKSGRSLKVLKTFPTIQKARQRQEEGAFWEVYRHRAGVEGLVSVTANKKGMRRSRYIGQAKTALQALLTAIAINLERAALWLEGHRPAPPRRDRLQCLAPQPA